MATTMQPIRPTRSTLCAAIAACALAVGGLGCLTGQPGPNHGRPDVIALDAPRTAFVQLFEWKWTDIARECETYLGPKGFAAVQISPPNEHNWITSGDGAPYPWWMRYQPVSYSLDNSRSGNRAQFIDMVNRCNAVGVGIYADAVINHMTSGSGTTSSAGNDPWGVESYPRVPYGPGDFHATCTVSNYQDAGNVQSCQLVGLQDLNTGAGYVRGKLADYLVDLATIGVKGFRVDAAKHISPGDLGAIISAVNARVATRPYWFLEVIGAAGEAVQPAQYFSTDDNLVNVTEFAYGQQLFGKFAGGGKLADLRTFGESWGLMPSNRGVAFTDNHDTQRGHAGGGGVLTYHNGPTYDLANVFMLAWPYGFPVVMSSYAFNTSSAFDTSFGPPFDTGTGATRGPWDGNPAQPACLNQAVGGWVCEHRFRPIGNMVGFRNATVSNWFVTDWWDNGGNQIAFGRGNQGFVVINKEGGALGRSFHTSLPAGSYCNVISGDYVPATGGAPANCTGSVATVDGAGNVTFNVAAFTAAAIHVGAIVPAGTGGGSGGGSGTPTTVTVTFNEAADTLFGQNIFVTGSIAELSSWNPGSAVPLTWLNGSGTRGNWRAIATLPASTHVEYKYIKKDGAGNVIWESGANRVLDTGAGGTAQTVNDAWK
ncbi:MAG TPA: carbohydrate-binding module family 20 domain-containing protein [Kofleriaceae bacterium]|nr:carbohydrate-binding module family 20 domain-containing protein [Kofleriaceae bacterium]